ncbi:MAG: DUF1636 family protein [Rhizobiaceae bacterium]
MTSLDEGGPEGIPVEGANGRDGRVTIVVCDSCLHQASPETAERGGSLLARVAEAADPEISVRSIACLGNCKRRLSAALLRDNSWSYVFGDLTEESAADLVAGARLFAASPDALLPWRGRPEALKRGLVARIPPRHLLEEPA